MVKILTIIAMVSLGLAAGLVYLQPVSDAVTVAPREETPVSREQTSEVMKSNEQKLSHHSESNAVTDTVQPASCDTDVLATAIEEMTAAVVTTYNWQLATTSVSGEGGQRNFAFVNSEPVAPCAMSYAYTLDDAYYDVGVSELMKQHEAAGWYGGWSKVKEHFGLSSGEYRGFLAYADGATSHQSVMVRPIGTTQVQFMLIGKRISKVSHTKHDPDFDEMCPCDYEIQVSLSRPVWLTEL